MTDIVHLPSSTSIDAVCGLPMGMDFSADLGEEALLLGLALELEAAYPWPSLA